MQKIEIMLSDINYWKLTGNLTDKNQIINKTLTQYFKKQKIPKEIIIFDLGIGC